MRALTTKDPVTLLLQRIAALPTGPGRRLIAVAGQPASGKSTLAAALVAALNSPETTAALVPMDGFHLDNALLRDRSLLERKGAPETFDAAGLVHAMRRLKSEPHVVLPSFDRHRDIAIAGAIEITALHRLVLVEGNYLCFDEDPGARLPGFGTSRFIWNCRSRSWSAGCSSAGSITG